MTIPKYVYAPPPMFREHIGRMPLNVQIREYLRTTRREWWDKVDHDLLEEIIECVLDARELRK